MSVRARTRLKEVEVQALDAARLESLIGSVRMARFEVVAEAAQSVLAGHSVLNVNSTATGAEWPRCCKHCWRMCAGRVWTLAGW